MSQIICAILTKYYTLTDSLSVVWEVWYIRETSMALLVGNLLLCTELLRRIFAYFGTVTGLTSVEKTVNFEDSSTLGNTHGSIGHIPAKSTRGSDYDSSSLTDIAGSSV
jgi:hypothetical protein